MVILAGQKLSTGECIWADWGGFVRGWDALSCPENKKTVIIRYRLSKNLI
jgi:hypothetical protein